MTWLPHPATASLMLPPLATKRTSSRALSALVVAFMLPCSHLIYCWNLAMLCEHTPAIFMSTNLSNLSHASLFDIFIRLKQKCHTSSAYFKAPSHDSKWSRPCPPLGETVTREFKPVLNQLLPRVFGPSPCSHRRTECGRPFCRSICIHRYKARLSNESDNIILNTGFEPATASGLGAKPMLSLTKGKW